MTTEIVLASPTTFLRIILETENCSFTHSQDGSVLFVETRDNSFITRSDLSLTNAAKEEIWSASISTRGSFNQERIRLDGIFPFVFNNDETVQVFPSMILSFDSNCTCKGNTRNIFELRVKIALSSEKAPAVPKVTDIYSATIVVEETPIPVSKELVVASSPFFENLFNANFHEKANGVYEIKEVSVDDFRWFIDSLHRRKWEFSSVDRALLALSYADRFDILNLHSRVYPYLKIRKLPQDSIKDTLILCSKFKGIDNLILWVLNHFEKEEDALQLLEDCAPQMNTTAVQASFKALNSFIHRKKHYAVQLAVRETVEKAISDMRNRMQDRCIIMHLRCYDLDNSVGKEGVFVLEMDRDRDIDWESVFNNIPTVYVIAKCGDKTRLRSGGDSYIRVSEHDRVLYVNAYRK